MHKFCLDQLIVKVQKPSQDGDGNVNKHTLSTRNQDTKNVLQSTFLQMCTMPLLMSQLKTPHVMGLQVSVIRRYLSQTMSGFLLSMLLDFLG